MTNPTTIIEEHLSGILLRLGLHAEISSVVKDGVIEINAKTENDDLILAHRADPLLAIQHILRIILKQQTGTDTASLVLNIGDFHRRQAESLAQLAQEMADKALAENRPQALPSMSSYERRMVHMALADRADVESASEGEGPTRRIIVRPKVSA